MGVRCTRQRAEGWACPGPAWLPRSRCWCHIVWISMPPGFSLMGLYPLLLRVCCAACPSEKSRRRLVPRPPLPAGSFTWIYMAHFRPPCTWLPICPPALLPAWLLLVPPLIQRSVFRPSSPLLEAHRTPRGAPQERGLLKPREGRDLTGGYPAIQTGQGLSPHFLH